MTMESSVYVTATGPALSLLLYETTKTAGSQMGFLLGAVVNHVTDTISDSQISGEKTETIINVSSILPLPFSTRIMNGAGKIDEEKLEILVRSEKKQQLRNSGHCHDIIGWYSFKRNSLSLLSMRENVVHLQLAEMAQKFSDGNSSDLFVLCLLSNTSLSSATHVFKHAFLRYLSDKQTFEPVPLQIHNLGMSQSSKYQNTACAPSKAALLKEIFGRTSTHKQDGDHMLHVQSELQIMLNQRVQQLSNAENSRLKLENDVQYLREKLKDLKKKLTSRARNSLEGQNNGLENSFEYNPNRYEKRDHLRGTKRLDGDASEGHCNQEHDAEGNNVNSKPTSPVLNSKGRGRRRAARVRSPEPGGKSPF